MAGEAKPILLDLFCGAGGCTKGYQRAGFYVVGVDVKPQPSYCGDEFIHLDAAIALEGLLHRGLTAPVGFNGCGWYALCDFAAIHASPPCQASSAATPRRSRPLHAELIPQVRELLDEIGLPSVIENVMGAKLTNPVMLCGTAFGLELQRHRLFETNFPLMSPGCTHGSVKQVYSVTGTGYGGKHAGHSATKPDGIEHAREVMGIDWMGIRELSQAIPPAYTEHVGSYLLSHINQPEATHA